MKDLLESGLCLLKFELSPWYHSDVENSDVFFTRTFSHPNTGRISKFSQCLTIPKQSLEQTLIDLY